MKKSDFCIGTEFFTGAGKWRCTDVGTRVIVAIKIDDQDSCNFAGPPYSITECVFDEYDLDGCSLDASEFQEEVVPNKSGPPDHCQRDVQEK